MVTRMRKKRWLYSQEFFAHVLRSHLASPCYCSLLVDALLRSRDIFRASGNK